jgi:TolB protein
VKPALLALLIAVAVGACSGGSSDAPSPASLIALIGDDGNVSTFDPSTGVLTAVTGDAGAGRVYSQPTWSPDGTRLAFVASATAVTGPAVEAGPSVVRTSFEAQDATSAIHIAPASGGPATVIPTPFAAFYLYWAPDGASLAFLGNDLAFGRQALGMIDVGAGTAERLDSGQPYYFAWSPDSDRLLVHAAGSELYLLGLDGTRQAVGPSPGGFSAPNWVGDTRLFPVAEGDRRVLRISDADGAGLRDATEYGGAIAIELNPDGERVAYIDITTGANLFALGTLVVDGPDGAAEIADLAAAFFWSADGSRLLYLTPDVSGGDFALRWNVWNGNETVAFERFLPTTVFLQQYLPFFGQYANSLSFLSPDAGAFTFAGTIEGRGSGIWQQTTEPGSPAQLIAPGEFSTWAP